MKIKELHIEYCKICNMYIKAFEKKHDIISDGWVGDEIGGIASFACQYFFNLSDIILDLNTKQPKGNILNWQSEDVDFNMFNEKQQNINYKSYTMGLRHEHLKDVMLSLFSQFGWVVKTGDEQKNGSCADIYAEHDDEDGKYTMRIDDGNCHNELYDAVYHIYATGDKVFDGRIGTPEDFIVVMRVLGFEKQY